MHNYAYWREVFLGKFTSELETFVDILEKRLLPSFDDIEEEARRQSEEAWDAFMASPGAWCS